MPLQATAEGFTNFMAILSGTVRLRGGTDAQRQAAGTLHAREPHFTSGDRLEFWVGTNLINGRGYHASAPDPAGGGYAISTTPDFPVRWRSHFGRLAPVEYAAANYEHTIILPNVAGAMAPRNGDEAAFLVILPACVTRTITLTFRNASIAGTQLAQLVSVLGEAVRKWRLEFVVTGGAWELVGAAELLLV